MKHTQFLRIKKPFQNAQQTIIKQNLIVTFWTKTRFLTRRTCRYYCYIKIKTTIYIFYCKQPTYQNCRSVVTEHFDRLNLIALSTVERQGFLFDICPTNKHSKSLKIRSG